MPLLSVALVVCLVGAGWLFVTSLHEDELETPAKTKKFGKIASATSVKSVLRPEEMPPDGSPKPQKTLKALDDGRLMLYHEDGSPAWAYPRIPDSKVVVTNNFSLQKTAEEEVFSHPADVEIAWLLNTEAGEQVIGDWNYKNFTQKFLNACKEPIRIERDDSPEVRTLKQAVIDVREDLLKRYRQGENIEETMAAARKELQELGMYREELKAEIRRISKDDDGTMTESDYEDLINAANQMLSERGATPVQVPAFIKYKFKKESMEDYE